MGPRDGLQKESEQLGPRVRAEPVDRLSVAGLRGVEVASFVNPARVPRRSGAEEVCATAQTVAGVDQVGPVLNRRGYERLAATACTEARMTDVLDRPLPGQLLRAGGFGAPAPS